MNWTLFSNPMSTDPCDVDSHLLDRILSELRSRRSNRSSQASRNEAVARRLGVSRFAVDCVSRRYQSLWLR